MAPRRALSQWSECKCDFLFSFRLQSGSSVPGQEVWKAVRSGVHIWRGQSRGLGELPGRRGMPCPPPVPQERPARLLQEADCQDRGYPGGLLPLLLLFPPCSARAADSSGYSLSFLPGFLLPPTTPHWPNKMPSFPPASIKKIICLFNRACVVVNL